MSDQSFRFIRAWISIGSLAALILYLWHHEPLPALPSVYPQDLKPYENAEFRIAATDAVKEILGLIIGLAFGLSAVVGFVIKDGFGKTRSAMLMNLALVCLFIYFICRVFVFGYDCYASIAVQLDRGFVFIGNLQQIVYHQVRSLAVAALLALALLFINYAWNQDPTA